MVVFDDIAKEALFRPGSESTAKLMIESRGILMEEKYKSAEFFFVGTPSFITLNSLPKCLKERGPPNETEDQQMERERHFATDSTYSITRGRWR